MNEIEKYMDMDRPECMECHTHHHKQSGSFVRHIRKAHGMEMEDYYMKYLYIEEVHESPTCNQCGKKVTFFIPDFKYREFCSVACRNKNPGKKLAMKNTMLKKYGVESNVELKETRKNVVLAQETIGIKNDLEKSIRTRRQERVNENEYVPPIYSVDGDEVISSDEGDMDGFEPI